MFSLPFKIGGVLPKSINLVGVFEPLSPSNKSSHNLKKSLNSSSRPWSINIVGANSSYIHYRFAYKLADVPQGDSQLLIECVDGIGTGYHRAMKPFARSGSVAR